MNHSKRDEKEPGRGELAQRPRVGENSAGESEKGPRGTCLVHEMQEQTT